jgi:hypothetical protein
VNMHNFPLGPAKPGDGPSPDRDSSAKSRSGTPIRPVGPTPTAGLEAGLRGAPQYQPRVAARSLSPITEGPAAVRDALFRCADAMADGFGRDWEREEIERRARAWEQRQRHG